jgi:hypothetical protein
MNDVAAVLVCAHGRRKNSTCIFSFLDFVCVLAYSYSLECGYFMLEVPRNYILSHDSSLVYSRFWCHVKTYS